MIFVLGPFPPPVHGASEVTKRAANALEDAGFKIVRHNLAPSPFRGPASHTFGRIISYARMWLRLKDIKRGDLVYISLSGGLGLVYDLVTILLLRFKSVDLIFHHHSYAYLTSPKTLMKIISGLCAYNGRHIMLSQSMSDKFKAAYGSNHKAIVVSNLAFFDPAASRQTEASKPLRRIGYLSNISFDKGIDRFLDLVEALRKAGSKLEARIAGPFADKSVETHVRDRISEIGGIEYVGPVYGEAKEEFFSTIDFFFFPTRYHNEAQPMVVFEAKLHGVPVALSDRGSLRDMAGIYDIILDETSADTSRLLEWLIGLEQSPEKYIKVQHQSEIEAQQLVVQSQLHLDAFINEFKTT